MKPTPTTLPVSQELFRDMVRLHVYGRTDEALAKELNIDLKVVRAVRWGFQEQWDAAVEALIPSFTKEMVFQTVAAIHLLASITTDTKELATLAHAEERHLKLVQPKKTRTKKARPQRPTIEELLREDEPATFTADELAVVARLRAEHSEDVVFLCELQVRHEELYLKCFRAGILPPWPDPKPPAEELPPPTPPPDEPRPTVGQRLRSATIAVLLPVALVFSACWWALAHPPSR